MIVYTLVVPFSALTVTLTGLTPSFKFLALSLIVTVAFVSLAIADTSILFVPFGTVNVYDVVSLSNAGEIVWPETLNDFNVASSLLVSSGCVLVSLVIVNVYVLVVPSSAVTIISTVFTSFTLKLVFPLIFTEAFESSGTACKSDNLETK